MNKGIVYYLLGVFSALAILGILLLSSFSITGFSVYNGNLYPKDRIDENNLLLFDDMLIIKVGNLSISEYALSGSMGPYFGQGANGIRVKPKSSDEINEGDIVSFRLNNEMIVHRIIKRGFDEEGVYFITRGDNNLLNDDKLRFSDIEYVTIGIIW